MTSGIVYPSAIQEIAKKFHFVGIGGTSAGAIAAAVTAAAEYRHRHTQSIEGFNMLKEMSDDMSRDGRLLSLLQPDKSAEHYFDLALPIFNGAALLGLLQVPESVREAALAFGATPRYLMWKVDLHMADWTILVGANQTILQWLSSFSSMSRIVDSIWLKSLFATSNIMYIWESEDWQGSDGPTFHWQSEVLQPRLDEVTARGAHLIAQHESLAGSQEDRASSEELDAAQVDALIASALHSSEIEGEHLDVCMAN